MNPIPPPDDAAHDDSVFMAAIANVSNQLGRYVLRVLDADAGRAEPMSPLDERALADSVAAITEALRDRTALRERCGESPALPAHPLTQLTLEMPETASHHDRMNYAAYGLHRVMK